MTPGIALLVIGGILLVAGWKNQNIVDVTLGRSTTRPTGNVGSGGSVAPSGDASSPGGGQGTAPSTGAVGTIHFDGHPVAAWIVPALRAARKSGMWKGTVSSGWRSFAEQKAIYDSGVRPAAVPGTSNHEGSIYPRGAVDVTDAAGLDRFLRQSKWRHILIYAGSKDPVHFSHPHNGGY